MDYSKYFIEDFTEKNYISLIEEAQSKYNFISYNQHKSSGKNIIWRHDIDYSVHRAAKLAKIEADIGMKSTYFIHLHSTQYNVFEKEITELIFQIIEFGHDIGVHFEPGYYGIEYGKEDIESYLVFEKEILKRLFGVDISSFSFHNPDIGNWMSEKREVISELINVYSDYFKNNYGYCSDSYGYWRYRRLGDVIQTAEEEKLQILTHPEWWVPESMTPRNRIT